MTLSKPLYAYIYTGEYQPRPLKLNDRMALDFRKYLPKARDWTRFEYKTIYKMTRQAQSASDYKATLYVINLFLNYGRRFEHSEFTTRLTCMAENCGQTDDAQRYLWHYKTWLKNPPHISLIKMYQRQALRRRLPGNARAFLKLAREDWQIPLDGSLYNELLHYTENLHMINTSQRLSENIILLRDARKMGIRVAESVLFRHAEASLLLAYDVDVDDTAKKVLLEECSEVLGMAFEQRQASEGCSGPAIRSVVAIAAAHGNVSIHPDMLKAICGNVKVDKNLCEEIIKDCLMEASLWKGEKSQRLLSKSLLNFAFVPHLSTDASLELLCKTLSVPEARLNAVTYRGEQIVKGLTADQQSIHLRSSGRKIKLALPKIKPTRYSNRAGKKVQEKRKAMKDAEAIQKRLKK